MRPIRFFRRSRIAIFINYTFEKITKESGGKIVKKIIIAAALLLCLGVSAHAFAIWPEGQWEAKFFND